MSAKVSQRFLYSLPTLAPPPDCQTFRRLCDTSKCMYFKSRFLSNNYFDFLLTHQGQKQPIEKYDFGSLKFDLFLLIRQVSRVIMSVYLFLVEFFFELYKVSLACMMIFNEFFRTRYKNEQIWSF